MFTIDLLKGQGIPTRSRPEPIAAVAITIALPIIVSVAMLVSFLVNRVNMSIAEGNITRIETEFEGPLGEVLKKQQLIEQEKKTLSDSLTEVASAMGNQTQWTPILVTIIKKMPQSVVLKAIDVKRDSKMVTRPNPNEKGKTIETSVPFRVLHLSIVKNQKDNFNREVENFRLSLLSDPLLQKKLDNIKLDMEPESYEMYLMFAPLI